MAAAACRGSGSWGCSVVGLLDWLYIAILYMYVYIFVDVMPYMYVKVVFIFVGIVFNFLSTRATLQNVECYIY